MSEIMKQDKHSIKFYKDKESLKNGNWYEWRSNAAYIPRWLKFVECLMVPVLYLLFKTIQFADWRKSKKKNIETRS